MCMICDHLISKKITIEEAVRNLIELRVHGAVSDEHYHQIIEEIKHAQKIEDNKITLSGINKK